MRGGLLQENRYTYKQQNPQYLGQELQYSLSAGPTEDRKCRDVFFVILYIAFWVVSIIVAGVAFSKGKPELLAAPFDSTGKQCGHALGYENYEYAYFNSYNLSQFACINECPGPEGLTSMHKCYFNSSQMTCKNFGSYETVKVVGLCFPMNDKISEQINLGLTFLDQALSDIKNTWQVSLAMLFISLVTSLIVMFFIKICGGCLVVSVIVGYFVILIGFGILCLEQASNSIDVIGLDQIGDADTLRTMAYILFGLAGISLIVVFCTFHKIRIGIMIIKTSASFVQEQCQTILVPVFMFGAIAVFFVFWITVSVYIFSSGTVGNCKGSPFACIDWDVGVKRSLALYFFGLFWNAEIVIGISQFVLASSAAYWYFGHLSGGNNSISICSYYCRAITRSFGSIIFGGLILCIFFILQIIFEILRRITKEYTVSADPATNAIAKCCIAYTSCCLACFERFIRFISRNAFIFMAITGQGFCSSAHESFYLVLRSSVQYAISHGAGNVIMLFSKLLITAFCTLMGYLMITSIEFFSEQIFNPFMPTLIFFVISFVVSSLFMDVFGISSDTFLICYSIEKDILKGVSRACPHKLRAVLEN